MALQTNRSSRLADTQTILFNGVETYGRWAQQSFLTDEISEDDITYLVIDNSVAGRPDLIADNEYGDSLLDWVIIAFNKPRSTLNWPRSGDVIRLPKRRLVATEVA